MWNPPTVNLFLEEIAAHSFQDFYHLAVLTGMRRSEFCGLKWEKVDLVAGRLSVVQTLQFITGVGLGLMEVQPKTRRFRQSIALSPRAVDLLHAVRGKQLAVQM